MADFEAQKRTDYMPDHVTDSGHEHSFISYDFF